MMGAPARTATATAGGGVLVVVLAIAALAATAAAATPATVAKVTDLYPRRGSYEGGTQLTLVGVGFAMYSGEAGLEGGALRVCVARARVVGGWVDG